MTWNADTLAALLTEPESLEDLVAALDDLTEADRSAIRTTLGKAIPSLRRHLGKNEEWGRLPLLAAVVGATPAQCASVFAPQEIWRLKWSPDIARNRLISWLIDNGPDWSDDFVTRLLKRRGDADIHALIDELVIAHDLPIPDDPGFLTAWAVKNAAHPRPGRRWEEHFIAACAAPSALIQHLGSEQHTQIQKAVADLRVTEPTDDDALLLALLHVFERGDDRSSQQFALTLITDLGLAPLLMRHLDRFLAALPNADPVVVKFAVEQLLPLGLGDDHLTTLALDVLARKEKGVKRTVLTALRSVNDPSQDLMEMLTAITTGPDSTAAGLARELLDGWGTTTGATESLGLWRDPLGIPPEPLDDLERLLDEVEFDELIHRLDSEAPGNWAPVEVYERGLAALVALGWAEGRDAVAERLHDTLNHDPNTHGMWKQLVQRWLQRVAGQKERGRSPRGAALTRVAIRRCNDVLDAIGQVPCLLSTPTHKNNRVSWDKFRDRLRRYAEKNVEVLPIDLFVALGRIDRSEAAPCTLPGRVAGGRTVQEVVDLWLTTPAEPGRMSCVPPSIFGNEQSNQVCRRVRMEGDEPVVAKILKVAGPWDRARRAPERSGEHEIGSTLLPAHPIWAATAAQVNLPFGSSSAWEITEAVASVFHVDPVMALLAFVFASGASPQGRDEIAGALLTAWDESRLGPEVLVAAWDSSWRQEWRDDIAPVKVAAMLTTLAEAGGLALAWPLLTRIAEELAGAEKLPIGVATVLESVLHLLPEVPGKPDLPTVAALAARKGSSKAIKVARQIVAAD